LAIQYVWYIPYQAYNKLFSYYLYIRDFVMNAKQRFQRSIIGWVAKIYYLLGLTSGRRPVVKIIAESLSQHDEKHVVPTPLSVRKG
jgi:hypothetical protein